MEKACELCGTTYRCKPSHFLRRKFCSLRCLGLVNGERVRRTGGGFQPGHVPWSKGLRGIHFSPDTEFKKGRPNGREKPIGTVTVRIDRNGNPRAFVKVAEKGRYRERARVVWTAKHGPIPRGMLIHHRDRNSLNDSLDNLQLMTRGEHVNEHRSEQTETRWRRYWEARGATER